MQDTVETTTLAQRVAEFEHSGYTVFRGFNAAWIEHWRPVFMEHYRRQLGQDQHGRGVGQPRAVLRGLLQEYPDLFLPPLVAPEMLDFLEALMGPTVGFDSLQIAITPPVSERDAHNVHAWHRDMWALTGWTDDYLPPNAVNVLTYLQEGPEYGQLRVIPGSHRGSHLVGTGGSERAQQGQQVVPAAAGDTVVIHSSLLHTTSGNYSGNLRIFASFFYTRAWLPKRDGYGMERMQRAICRARSRGDRRVVRLFEPDADLLARRASVDAGEYTEEHRWQQWRAEEEAERSRATAAAGATHGESGTGVRAMADAALEPAIPADAGSRAASPATSQLLQQTGAAAADVPDLTARGKTSDGAPEVQDGAVWRPHAPPSAAGTNPVATADAVGADDGAGNSDVAPVAAAGSTAAPPGPADADATAEPVLHARAELGEGPVWDAASGTLWWVDLFAGLVHSYRPDSGITGSVEVGEIIGCVVPRQSGGLLAATVSGIYHLDPASGARTRVSAIEADRPETHFNDGKVDPAGRFWFGSIAIDRTSDVLGDLYSLEPDLTVTHRLRGVDNTNGMDWSPDGRTMYYIDSLTRQVTAYDYDAASGAIANPRALVTLPEGTGVPDGMTVSLDGSLWVAHWGGARVTRWHPHTGALLQTIAVPANLTTSCAFAGPAMDELYITTARYHEPISALAAQPLAGGLFRYRTDTTGRPAAVFPG
jgi:sugar lactone lactonase YvrE